MYLLDINLSNDHCCLLNIFVIDTYLLYIFVVERKTPDVETESGEEPEKTTSATTIIPEEGSLLIYKIHTVWK